MAITSKIFSDLASLAKMLDAVFNASTLYAERFQAESTTSGIRGVSGWSNLYAAAATGSGVATIALSGSVVINVDASSTGVAAVDKIVYAQSEDINNTQIYLIYTITISPAEEFIYAGTITITTATITLSGTMT